MKVTDPELARRIVDAVWGCVDAGPDIDFDEAARKVEALLRPSVPEPQSPGVDAPAGPGWWQSSEDGRWYPPYVVPKTREVAAAALAGSGTLGIPVKVDGEVVGEVTEVRRSARPDSFPTYSEPTGRGVRIDSTGPGGSGFKVRMQDPEQCSVELSIEMTAAELEGFGRWAVQRSSLADRAWAALGGGLFSMTLDDLCDELAVVHPSDLEAVLRADGRFIEVDKDRQRWTAGLHPPMEYPPTDPFPPPMGSAVSAILEAVSNARLVGSPPDAAIRDVLLGVVEANTSMPSADAQELAWWRKLRQRFTVDGFPFRVGQALTGQALRITSITEEEHLHALVADAVATGLRSVLEPDRKKGTAAEARAMFEQATTAAMPLADLVHRYMMDVSAEVTANGLAAGLAATYGRSEAVADLAAVLVHDPRFERDQFTASVWRLVE